MIRTREENARFEKGKAVPKKEGDNRMSIYRRLFILCACVIAFASNGLAETTLVIATGELPPYVGENQNESFLTEVLQAVGREMDVRFEFRFMPWKRCELAVEKLEAWGAIPYVRTPEREVKFHFSEKLFDIQSKFFYYSPKGMQKQIPYAELSDLKGYVIGAVRGYFYEKWFIDAGLHVEFAATEEQNFQKLQAGRVDLIPADQLVGLHIIRNRFPREAGNFFTISRPLLMSGDYLLTSKQYPDTQNLLARFNSALDKVKKNGIYKGILVKHGVPTYIID